MKLNIELTEKDLEGMTKVDILETIEKLKKVIEGLE